MVVSARETTKRNEPTAEKISRYEIAKDWSDSDLRTVWPMIMDELIAIKAILWTLIASILLTPLNEYLHR